MRQGDASDFHALGDRFQNEVVPLLEQYCLECHRGEAAEAEVDFEHHRSVAGWRQSPEIWQRTREMLRSGQMPPKESKQLSDAQSETLLSWVRAYLKAESESRAGDPGPVTLRRLSNAEYTYTLRDLTGVDSLSPAAEFPIDGAAGEGFTNVGDGLVMSPSLVNKYLEAAKEVAGHLVLLPDGIEFSRYKTRRDWTDQWLARIQAIYHDSTANDGGTAVDLQGIKFSTNEGGRLAVEKYLAALMDERASLAAGTMTIEELARRRGLSAKYLTTLWNKLTDAEVAESNFLLAALQQRFSESPPDSAAEIAADIEAWQKALWKFNSVGQFGRDGGPKAWMEAIPLRELDLSSLAFFADADPNVSDAAIEEFRDLFPPALCYSQIVPVDEVVTLTLFFREDDHLQRLMLDDDKIAELDRLWDELLYISREPLQLVVSLEQLSEFATQDRPDLVDAFAPLREPIADRAQKFRERLVKTEPLHLTAIVQLADRAWRRPLNLDERADLRSLYQRLRDQDIEHEQAIRLTLARVLTSPDFLYRRETARAGPSSTNVTDEELACRLSYFLWSSLPDDQLGELARLGKLSQEPTLRAQTARMLGDPRAGRLAEQFACQWLHVRGFDQNVEKNEKLYPEYASLRTAMYEETIRFFEDMFRGNGSILGIVDADHTFVNEALARHYGIDGISGSHWRRIDDVRRIGRGGVLGMASVLASQSGASRTSPILRGNWVYETLLGERLPRPPAGVPQLPDQPPAGLTSRQLIEQHSGNPGCAKCHAKIDPFGFSLEQFDAIGRRRPDNVDTETRLPGGEIIDGIDGLKDYLIESRRDDLVRQFSRKLLGYALGREVQLSDEPLLETMHRELAADGYRFHTAVGVITSSPQFRQIRGRDFVQQ